MPFVVEMTLKSCSLHKGKRALSTFFPCRILSLYLLFVDYPLGGKMYMHYDGNEDKVEADSTIFQYYTLFSFFLSLVADD